MRCGMIVHEKSNPANEVKLKLLKVPLRPSNNELETITEANKKNSC